MKWYQRDKFGWLLLFTPMWLRRWMWARLYRSHQETRRIRAELAALNWDYPEISGFVDQRDDLHAVWRWLIIRIHARWLLAQSGRRYW